MILAGDVGGTKTNLAVFDARLRPVLSGTFSSSERGGLGEIVREFVADAGRGFDRACFGVAGPVIDGRSRITNLPWVVDAKALAAELGIAAVWLLNDLEATAYGIAALKEEELVVLSAGAPGARGNAAIIAAGTGLGEAGMYWDGSGHRPFACEGGHGDFSPRDDLEIELLRYLRARMVRVGWERILSGPGLHRIYEFLRDTGRGEEPAWLVERLRVEDPTAAISGAALEGTSPLCSKALDLFVSLYGAEAGNLALKVMATGGVYVGGGIAPRILERLRGPLFMDAFTAKEPMRDLVASIPVRVILNDRCALLGAARYARRTRAHSGA